MEDEKEKKTVVPNFDSDYDPYANRHVKSPTTDLESLAHITKGILGTGILALPEGFSYAGGVMAIFYCLLSGILCTVGMHILVRGFYTVCKVYQLPVVSYANAMKLGLQLGPKRFAKYNKAFAITTDFFIIFYQMGVICVYILFCAVTTETVTNNILGKNVPLGYYLFVFVIPCMLSNSVKNLKLLAPFSYFGLAVTVMVIFVLFYYTLVDGLLPFTGNRKYTGDILKLPMFFGTTLFSFAAVPIVVNVENNMANPGHFHWLYDIGITILILLYISVGFLSYWKWGDEINSVVILNFPLDQTLARVSNYLFALGIFLTIGLNGIVPVRVLMDSYILPKLESAHPILWEYLLRIGSIALALYIAISVPHIGSVISLLGTVPMSCLALIFPSVLDICCRYQTGYGKLKMYLVLDVLMICYGFVGLTTGVYVNLYTLYKKMYAPHL